MLAKADWLSRKVKDLSFSDGCSRGRVSIVAAVGALLALLVSIGIAQAHVSVNPKEAEVKGSQTYVFRVPTEKSVPTVKVRIEFPPEVTVSRFAPKPGWKREVEKDNAGKLVAVTWSGGQIAPDEYDEFVLSARNPDKEGKIAWKAYQTYQDGETVAWTGPEGSEKPAPVTTIKAAPAPVTSGGKPEDHDQNVAPQTGKASPDAGGSAAPAASAGSDLPLFIALGSGVLALIAVALSVVALARRPGGA